MLAPGNRASVLVKAGTPGTYFLRTLQFQMGSRLSILDEDIVAEVVVVDARAADGVALGALPVPAALAPDHR